ncbi:hypothetical protein UB43_21030 [Pseudomonas sp. 21]|uniref:hypothetical protein n=1 Tax=unclassified Pseudomonas TaxID=196821 RepID=UPI0005EB8461|nr:MULTISPECIES: hypothetical protein [unclassified Pseudomonas]KJJ97989.1 hypothetical protein UB43_21030 [Pseudomonas sp. 21]MBV7586877.1 hypothetical protein [Pseudomonas sp. PDM33]
MTIHPLGYESAKLMGDAGYAVDTIGKLILEDICRKSDDANQEFLREYELGGLLSALQVIAAALCDTGERLENHLKKAEQYEEGAK